MNNQMMKVFSAISFIALLVGCGDLYRSPQSGEVGLALKKTIRDEQRQEVVLKNLTSFQWDELFLFDPYFPTDQVCKRLNLDLVECTKLIQEESTDDGAMLMVFRNKGRIVHVEMHFRWNGDFTPAPAEPFNPESAVFLVVEDGKSSTGGEWFRLRQQTLP